MSMLKNLFLVAVIAICFSLMAETSYQITFPVSTVGNNSTSWDTSTIANNSGPRWNGYQYVNNSSTYVLVAEWFLPNISNATAGALAWNLTNLTLRNGGTATSADIAGVEVWLDLNNDGAWNGLGGGDFHCASNTTVYAADPFSGAANQAWLFQLNNSTPGVNGAGCIIDSDGRWIFILVNITATPTQGRTIRMAIPTQTGAADCWTAGDVGAFGYKENFILAGVCAGVGGPSDIAVNQTNATYIQRLIPGAENYTTHILPGNWTPGVNSTGCFDYGKHALTVTTTLNMSALNNTSVYVRIIQMGTATYTQLQLYNTTDIDGYGGGSETGFLKVYNSTYAHPSGSGLRDFEANFSSGAITYSGYTDTVYFLVLNITDLATNTNSSVNQSTTVGAFQICIDNIYCGNGRTDTGETCNNCPADRGYCHSPSTTVPSGPTTQKLTYTIASITAGETATFNYETRDRFNINIQSIEVYAINTMENARVTVEKILPDSAALPAAAPGTVYRYIEIATRNIEAADMSKAVVKFKVEKTWLTAEGITQNDIVLSKYTGTEWADLPTTLVSEDADFYYYSAETAAFSFYAIRGEVGAVEDCRTLGCDTGYECQQIGTIWQCVELPPCDLTCTGNFALDYAACQCVCQLTTCPTGQELDATACACEPIVCPEGQELVEGVCQEKAVAAFDATWVLVIIVIIIIAIAAVALSKRGKKR